MPSPVNTSPINEPFYFEAGEHRLFAWLERPAGVQADFGLVICKPFGYEALCAHSSMRAFADAAVDQGVPTMRFDYLGTGDSPDIDPTADQIDVWTRDIAAAVAELRRRTGVTRVALLGIRLGALLAARVAAEAGGIVGLFTVAPVVSGKRYLRELRTTRLAALMGHPGTEDAKAGDMEAANPGLMEFTGYALSAASISTLTAVELTAADLPSGIELCIVDRTDVPQASDFSDKLTKAGVRNRCVPLPGFVEMALVAPQFAVVPQSMIQALREFLHTLGAAPAASVIRAHQPAALFIDNDAPPTLTVDGETDSHDSLLTERPVCFGNDVQLFGIVTEPKQHETRRRAVIFLNAGTDYHMGASRMYVTLGRDWARRGYYVMRMDLAGIGDSGTRSGRPDNELFPPAALDDIRAALDFMGKRYGIRQFTLSGLCAGGYHALRAAAAGLPVDRILMVNPQNYFAEEGTQGDSVQISEVVANPGVYRQRIQSWHAWKRLFSGQVNLWRIMQIYAIRPLLSLEFVLRDVARFLHIRLPNDLGTELEDIARRGVHIAFVFASGEVGIDLLKMQAGLSLKRLGDRVAVRIIEGADHTFSRSAARLRMERTLTKELTAGPPVPGVVDHARRANAL